MRWSKFLTCLTWTAAGLSFRIYLLTFWSTHGPATAVLLLCWLGFYLIYLWCHLQGSLVWLTSVFSFISQRLWCYRWLYLGDLFAHHAWGISMTDSWVGDGRIAQPWTIWGLVYRNFIALLQKGNSVLWHSEMRVWCIDNDALLCFLFLCTCLEIPQYHVLPIENQ